ncbi:MAG: PGPGW domain-containing protein [bacterium]|nr:PGPGW domain-containing protein [bacterium]
MRKHTKRIVILSLGVIFIILGLVGLVLPFLQGFLFIAIGLLLLSLYSPTIRDWMDKHTKKYPKLHTMVQKAEEWMIRIIGRP